MLFGHMAALLILLLRLRLMFQPSGRHGPSGCGCLERLEVVRHCLLEGRRRLAALLIRLQRWSPGYDVGMAQDA
jgi:hypothetical protein